MKKVIFENNCPSCGTRYCAKKVSIFSSLTEAQLSMVTNLITRKVFKKGEVIFNEGEVSDKLFIINHGSIKSFTYTKDGKEQILYVLKEGDFFGDLSLLKRSKYSHSASALQDTYMCMLHKNDFDKILKENTEISINILEYMHDRILNLENLVQTITTKDMDSRLATLLLNFSEKFGVKTEKGMEISFPLSREDMANYIGVTRETISRKLSSFEQEDVIELVGNKKIIIKDMEYIRKLI